MIERRGLGRGLSALLDEAHAAGEGPAAGQREIPIEQIHRNTAQPRTDFSEADLESLTASIREKGVLQPLLVRFVPREGCYYIISGERRYHSARAAGLREVPAIEKTADDAETLEIALIEILADTDPPSLPEEHVQLLRRFDPLQEEALACKDLNSLLDSEIITRVRELKQSLDSSFYHPGVLATIAPYNAAFGKKFDEFFHAAAVEIRRGGKQNMAIIIGGVLPIDAAARRLMAKPAILVDIHEGAFVALGARRNDTMVGKGRILEFRHGDHDAAGVWFKCECRSVKRIGPLDLLHLLTFAIRPGESLVLAKRHFKRRVAARGRPGAEQRVHVNLGGVCCPLRLDRNIVS